MAEEYIVPRISIDESDVGPRPSLNVSLAKIGIVGTFQKGPVNTPTLIGSVDQFVQKFGQFLPEYTGALSVLGVFNQGASEFEVVRIIGNNAATAQAVLEDEDGDESIIVEATSPGVWANGNMPTGYHVSVTAGSAPDTVKISIIKGNRVTSFDQITLDNVEQFKTDDIVLKKAPLATKLPALVSDIPLTGGNDGTVNDASYIGTITSDGMRTGLKALDPTDCAIVIAAQQSSAAIHASLLTHVANATIEEGLRVAVLNPPKGATVEAAVQCTASLDSNRGIMTYPWVEPQELQGLYVAPDGYYAGVLAQLKPHKSPSNKQIKGILSTERQLVKAEVKELTKARISPITKVKNRGFRIRNGVTLSSDPAWGQTSIRRIFDKIEQRIYNDTQWAISEDHTPKFRNDIATQIDAILYEMKTNEEIYDYKPTVCDDKNNPPELVQQRMLRALIRVRPIYAADYIDFTIQRLVGNEEV